MHGGSTAIGAVWAGESQRAGAGHRNYNRAGSGDGSRIVRRAGAAGDREGGSLQSHRTRATTAGEGTDLSVEVIKIQRTAGHGYIRVIAKCAADSRHRCHAGLQSAVGDNRWGGVVFAPESNQLPLPV